MKWAVAVISIGAGVLMGELIARVPAGHEGPAGCSAAAFSEALPEITAAIAAKKRTEAIHDRRGQFAERFRLVPGRM
jgi:hypothetical protein